MKTFMNSLLRKIDLRVVRASSYDTLIQDSKNSFDLNLAKRIDLVLLPKYFEYLEFSTAQLRQDLFVLNELSFMEGGYFVEFGATDGITLSNTFLLETKFNWNGILAEPAKIWHDDLTRNRKAIVDNNCVWKRSGEVISFREVVDFGHNGELSTIDEFSGSDNHAGLRKKGKKYDVSTISLMDLLKKHGAPKRINYLSIDTEGSEFDILEGFDFNYFEFDVITCEHNYSPNRYKIYELLTKNGYTRKFEDISHFDDWYIKERKVNYK